MDKNNENSEKKDNKKKIHCKNCRQEILAEKMYENNLYLTQIILRIYSDFLKQKLSTTKRGSGGFGSTGRK